MCDVARAMCITTAAAQSRRVNEVDMPLDEFGEGGLGFFLGVASKQVGVIIHIVPE